MALGELEWARKTRVAISFSAPFMTAWSWANGIAASVVKSAAAQ